MLLEPIKQKKSSEIVKDAILNYIQANKLQPGARLAPDRELALSLNCSRTVVREALKGLETVGVIEMKVGKGIFVSEFTLSNLLEKYHPALSDKIKDLQCLKEARLAIEIGIIGLVAERATRTDIDHLDSLIGEMERLPEQDKLDELDIEFHQTLATIARSPLLAEFSSLLRKFFALVHEEMTRRFKNDQNAMQRLNENTHQEHRSLVAAIEAKNKDLARQLMEIHLLLPNEQENTSQK
jgi:GntR family transcriptional regulator, transcriptional repressor for pyruvate dehydrogenase complex